MGMSARATIAWGINFGDPLNDEDVYDFEAAGVDPYDFEHKVMPGLFGFTEEPPGRPDGLAGDAHREWFKSVREPYNQRLDAAVPLTFENYAYELGGTALVLKRSRGHVDWSAEAVDPATLAPPSPEELAAFATVASRLGCEDAPVKLLLMATYG